MLPDGYQWNAGIDGFQLRLLDPDFPCAWTGAVRGGGAGCVLRWGVYAGKLNHRVFATEAGAMRFAEAWASKWDEEIQAFVTNRGTSPHPVGKVSAEYLADSARKDWKRRHGGNRNWWKNAK